MTDRVTRTLDHDALSALRPLFDRAGNAHNTQPWTLTTRDGTLLVGWDDSRRLGPSDPAGRDLRLSMGAFVETCLIVAADHGIAMGFEPDFDAWRRRIGRFIPTSFRYHTDFTVTDVENRRAWRGRWEQIEGPPRPVLDDGLRAVLDLECTRDGARLVVLTCRDVQGLLRDADRWFFADAGIVAELRDWTRLRRDHRRYHLDGLTDRALGLRRVEARAFRAALNPSVHRQGARFGLPGLLAASHSQAFAGDGPVVVLLGPGHADETHEVELGRLITRLWLHLGRAGLAAHPQSHLIDCPDTVGRLSELSGADGERALWVARVGRPCPVALAKTPRSPRMSGPPQT